MNHNYPLISSHMDKVCSAHQDAQRFVRRLGGVDYGPNLFQARILMQALGDAKLYYAIGAWYPVLSDSLQQRVIRCASQGARATALVPSGTPIVPILLESELRVPVEIAWSQLAHTLLSASLAPPESALYKFHLVSRAFLPGRSRISMQDTSKQLLGTTGKHVEQLKLCREELGHVLEL